MRTVARLSLAFVVLLSALFFLPRSAPQVLAQIVPTPTIPNLFPTPTPSPTASPTPSPEPTGGGNNGNNNNGNGNNNNNNGEDPPDDPSDDPKDRRGEPGDRLPGDDPLDKGKKKGDKDAPLDPPVYSGTYHPSGSFNTDKLVAMASRLRALGWSTDEILEKVYPPFIIAGDAAWSNTWGAPRFGPGPIVRTHEGQDVFCKYGAPILAAEEGTVEFGEGGLGGLVARLYRADGSYWYYAHLSDWNTEEFSSGDSVQMGDVIGYCGNTGNAITTPPHVHFGWYTASGAAKNPMRPLVRWLHEAEVNSLGTVERVTGKRIKAIDRLTVARRFGDAFLPDVSEVQLSGESLWATGSNPATGTFALAETIVREALARSDVLDAPQPLELGVGHGDDTQHAEERTISEMLGVEDTSYSESAD